MGERERLTHSRNEEQLASGDGAVDGRISASPGPIHRALDLTTAASLEAQRLARELERDGVLGEAAQPALDQLVTLLHQVGELLKRVRDDGLPG